MNCLLLKCSELTCTSIHANNSLTGIHGTVEIVQEGKGKVKVTLVQALRLCTGRTVHRGSRGIALLFHDHGTRRG